MISKKIGLIYLGSKGGGASESLELLKQLSNANQNIKIVISNKNEFLEDFKMACSHNVTSKVVYLDNFFLINYFKLFLHQRDDILDFLKDRELIYFHLPNPFDNLLTAGIMQNGIKVIRGVHDYRRHPGDFWPNRLSIQRIVKKSDYLIVFSDFVKNKIKTKKIILKSELPTPAYEVIQEVSRGTILFIGRIRKYKGLKILLKAWQLVYSRNPDLKLRICGSGNMKLPNNLHNIEFNQAWLTEEDLIEEICRADIVVFPYIEASQSGVLQRAQSLGKSCLVTNVGGLSEQLNTQNSLVVDANPKSIAEGILTLQREFPSIKAKSVGPNSKLSKLLVETKFVIN